MPHNKRRQESEAADAALQSVDHPTAVAAGELQQEGPAVTVVYEIPNDVI